MTTRTDTALATALATVTNRGQVHMAFAFQHGAPTCDTGERVTTTLATVPDGAGLADLVDAIVTARIPARRLCAHCFGARTRRTVRDRYLAAHNANAATLAAASR